MRIIITVVSCVPCIIMIIVTAVRFMDILSDDVLIFNVLFFTRITESNRPTTTGL